ncbi:hypothetical protein PMIN04_001183 [Paraphaeosphaeria minitans]|uniref:Uncharacterized protein n=1 Tax=Paraphaeosphaeria minitans TaxID=565426 RepID=A0A9P6GA36_9PLEO|nr:hypothetical protein PMIN01_09875 [Paraphaeosphaeria minitans]
MANPSGNPEPMPNLSSACPCGIINIPAVLESYVLLHSSDEDMHHHLRTWLATAYLDGNTKLSSMSEPLGRRIRSVEDLGMLVCAYSHARGLKRPRTNTMQHSLYFYGQGPSREEALAAGKYMQQWIKQQREMAKTKPVKKQVVEAGVGDEGEQVVETPRAGRLLPDIKEETVESIQDVKKEGTEEEADGWTLA